ncbi:Mut7-C RNAse domain-containing protein [Methylomarinum sp. Ch1-1]|uniref:Mut7-C RNAse domain-containing protein n=1 Tax=Methylomarinum roseum TaxID=3067653 RepID=A0AAU7NUE0_9GAMM|nr:Mut7-C RNAse domain-containing protein [Methylomarinum sp. Ch1-1]MDP4519313.1 Mut7-C RNAse domain-containing protein [Methylomarinum sp. Ch1-1]
MPTLHLRFYEELNDFLRPEQRKTEFLHTLNRNASVKDVIESLGVPHTEVELILVNGVSVDFSYAVQDNDRISIYPQFESLDISPLLRLRDKPLRQPRFVVDSNLGRLARYLRLLGFDCLYRNDYRDVEVAEIANRQRRIVLTRDRLLLRRKIITHGYFVRASLPREQVKVILRRFDLYRAVKPFSRCMRCNSVLVDVNKKQVLERLEPLTREHYRDFKRCDRCGQVYWRGSHYDRAQLLLKELIESEPD